jgi:hypothetical protein
MCGMATHTKKPEGQSVRRGIEVRFRIASEPYSQIQAAADADRRSVPNWILKVCLDTLAATRRPK